MRLRDMQDPGAQRTRRAADDVRDGRRRDWVDDFDETHNGKSRGTIFVQDADIGAPYSGISLYSPTYVPANLRLAPGDVLDMNGQYVEQQTIGTDGELRARLPAADREAAGHAALRDADAARPLA